MKYSPWPNRLLLCGDAEEAMNFAYNLSSIENSDPQGRNEKSNVELGILCGSNCCKQV